MLGRVAFARAGVFPVRAQVSRPRVCRPARYHPVIDFYRAELPQLANLVGGQLFAGNPFIHSVPTHSKVRSDLIRRLQADTCELCGSHENCEVHHIRKLVDVKKRWAGRREKPAWVQKMVMLRRKTLIVCRQCHLAIHNGTFDLPKA